MLMIMQWSSVVIDSVVFVVSEAFISMTVGGPNKCPKAVKGLA